VSVSSCRGVAIFLNCAARGRVIVVDEAVLIWADENPAWAETAAEPHFLTSSGEELAVMARAWGLCMSVYGQ
jgi:hypothetical protein